MDQLETSPDLAWPPLDARYLAPLQEAVDWILAQYAPLGIVACGSIVRGNPGPRSDFDLYVIHAAPTRQRVQRFFGSVPAEIFVNAPAAIRRYFADEHAASRPLTAHMLTTGFVILARDPVVWTLLDEAAAWLAKAPVVDDEQLLMLRYLVVDQLDNAQDLRTADPENAELLLHDAVRRTAAYLFKAHARFLPRDKELLTATTALDAEAGRLLRALYGTQDLDERFALAGQLARHILGVDGFFGWESTPQVYPPAAQNQV